MLNLSSHQGNAYFTNINNTIRLLIFRSLTTPTVGEDLKYWNSHTLLLWILSGTVTWKSTWQYLKKLN